MRINPAFIATSGISLVPLMFSFWQNRRRTLKAHEHRLRETLLEQRTVEQPHHEELTPQEYLQRQWLFFYLNSRLK